MIKEAIAKGETVEIAFANACRELGVDTTDAEFEILEMPQKKTFGLFGGAPAKVRAYIEEPDPVEERDPAQEAAGYLKSVLKEMGLPEAGVEIRREEAGAALTLSGEDIGFIIGHRGETLDALQYLASLVANHVEGSYFRITLDVGNYREKRKETLEALGKKMAARAVKTGRNSSLEPMNPSMWSAGLRGASGPSGATTGAAAAMTVAAVAAADITTGTAVPAVTGAVRIRLPGQWGPRRTTPTPPSLGGLK